MSAELSAFIKEKMKYLFKEWDKLKSRFFRRPLALFLDYDGTLSPIANHPRKAALTFKTKRLLRKIMKNPQCNLAIISGRALKDLKKRVDIEGIVYAGNHGLEIEGPKIKFESPLSLRYRRILQHIRDELNLRLSAIKGAFLEDKGLSLSLHYRLVERNQIPELKTILYATTILYKTRDEIKVKSGKKVFEIRPTVEWDKGKVVLWLLARWEFGLGDKDLIAVYLGDDVTDEDAFKALSQKGITVFVGEAGKSAAHYYLKDTREVAKFLSRIALLPRSIP